MLDSSKIKLFIVQNFQFHFRYGVMSIFFDLSQKGPSHGKLEVTWSWNHVLWNVIMHINKWVNDLLQILQTSYPLTRLDTKVGKLSCGFLICALFFCFVCGCLEKNNKSQLMTQYNNSIAFGFQKSCLGVVSRVHGELQWYFFPTKGHRYWCN